MEGLGEVVVGPEREPGNPLEVPVVIAPLRLEPHAHSEHPIGTFDLPAQAQEDPAALEKMIGTPVRTVRFGGDEVEQARALGAAHGESWQAIIAGAEVANQLAGVYIACCLKVQRANERQQAKRKRDRTDTGEQHATIGDGLLGGKPSPGAK